MEREKRTLLTRLRRNVKRAFVRPFRKKEPKQYPEQDLVDLEEFTGLDRASLLEYVERQKGRRISDEHRWLAPSSQSEYGWFYRGSRTYLFAADDAWERAAEFAQPGMRCLDFGGGGGRNAIGMAGEGAEVFYVDIGILNSAFVRFRALKRGLNLTVIDPLVEDDGRWRVDTAEAARRVGGFDLIVCDNVLEHVPDYHLVVKTLCAGLKPGGHMLECTPFKREKVYLLKQADEWDIHLLPRVSMEEAMAASGMSEVEDGLWVRAADPAPTSSAGS